METMGSIRRSGAVALCLMTAGISLGGIFHVEGQALRDRPRVMKTASAEAKVSAAVEPVALVAPSALAAPAVAPAASPTPTVAAEEIRIPNLYGLRLTYAERRIERKGLRIEAFDEDGAPVDLADREFYRVVGQSVRRGTSVAPGTAIQVTVRDRASSYSDWG